MHCFSIFFGGCNQPNLSTTTNEAIIYILSK